MLVEIHLIQNHAPSNLNRDETGSPKQCVFGGVQRARISSQCLKRTIRLSDQFRNRVDAGLAQRTRQLPEQVRQAFLKEGLTADIAEIAAKKASGFGNKDGKEQDANKRTGAFATAQTMFLTPNDIQAITNALLEAAKGKSAKEFEAVQTKDIQGSTALKEFRPASVDLALFGRMITSGAFRDVESSIQVAHAFSTHKVDQEFDYFTAVDDLRDEREDDDAGADMIGDVEFNSACYYKYFSIDIDGLVANLTGASLGGGKADDATQDSARQQAAQAVVGLLNAAILEAPTGKQNSFAAHQLPSLVLVEVRPTNVPISYANAFVKPVRSSGDLVDESLRLFGNHVTAISTGFNLEATDRLLLAPEYQSFGIDGVQRVSSLNALGEHITTAVANG